jgi:hypothetical protein
MDNLIIFANGKEVFNRQKGDGYLNSGGDIELMEKIDFVLGNQ